jgi:hypothetical protein
MIIQSRDAYAAAKPLVMMPHSPQPPLTVPPDRRKWMICGAAWPQSLERTFLISDPGHIFGDG